MKSPSTGHPTRDSGGCALCTAGLPALWPCAQCEWRGYQPPAPPKTAGPIELVEPIPVVSKTNRL